MLGIKKVKALLFASVVLCSLLSCDSRPSVEENCSNGVDEDQNGLTDCEDPFCFDRNVCVEFCDDGADNDGNGQVDCEDIQCEANEVCLPPEPEPEKCFNEFDDDLDGFTDCEDLEDCGVFSQCHCTDENVLFFDGSTALIFTGDTTGTLDIAPLICQDEGASELVFVIEPLVTRDFLMFLEAEDGANLVVEAQSGFCDDQSGSSRRCSANLFFLETEGLEVEAEQGRPILLFVGEKMPLRPGALPFVWFQTDAQCYHVNRFPQGRSGGIDSSFE